MDNNPFEDVPQHVRDRASAQGRQYFWAVQNEAGDVYYEGDQDNVTIGQIPGVIVLDKPKLDPWDSICLGNIKYAAWIPTNQNENAFGISRLDAGASHVSIFRKNFHTTFGLHYITYVLGLRWDEEMRERNVHICPPCRYIHNGQAITFPGGVDVITEPGLPNAFEKFVK